MFVIRPETEDDWPSIGQLLRSAFPTWAEAFLLQRLRERGSLVISLVAVMESHVVGHVGFSPVTAASVMMGVGLAPVAVDANHRRAGITAALVRDGLSACHSEGYTWAVVLGEPHYYERFGFRPAAEFGLCDAFGGGSAFQVMALAAGGIPAGAGLVHYDAAFDELVESNPE